MCQRDCPRISHFAKKNGLLVEQYYDNIYYIQNKKAWAVDDTSYKVWFLGPILYTICFIRGSPFSQFKNRHLGEVQFRKHNTYLLLVIFDILSIFLSFRFKVFRVRMEIAWNRPWWISKECKLCTDSTNLHLS